MCVIHTMYATHTMTAVQARNKEAKTNVTIRTASQFFLPDRYAVVPQRCHHDIIVLASVLCFDWWQFMDLSYKAFKQKELEVGWIARRAVILRATKTVSLGGGGFDCIFAHLTAVRPLASSPGQGILWVTCECAPDITVSIHTCGSNQLANARKTTIPSWVLTIDWNNKIRIPRIRFTTQSMFHVWCKQ